MINRGSRFLDITGQKFNRLTALYPTGVSKHGQAMWMCICECGKNRVVLSSPLRYGKTKSCGCLMDEVNAKQLINRVGLRFGSLVIISKNPGHRKKWNVLCDCGTEKVVLYGNLTSGCTTSCGCWKNKGLYQTDNTGVPFGKSSRNFVLDSYKRGAKSRNYSWNLSEKQFDKLTSLNCKYCNIKPLNVSKNPHGKGDFVYTGIDRVDNTKGYEPDNCVPCCKVCNRAKDTMTEQEFLDWVERVHSHSSRR